MKLSTKYALNISRDSSVNQDNCVYGNSLHSSKNVEYFEDSKKSLEFRHRRQRRDIILSSELDVNEVECW